MYINFIDIEASGLKNSYPIQIGGVSSEGLCFSEMIIPHEKWDDLTWDIVSENIHGIKRKRLYTEGKTLENVAILLNKFYKDKIVYVEQSMDIHWLNQLFDSAEIKCEFKYFLFFNYYVKEYQDHWHYAVSVAEKKLKLQRHDALNDAKIFQEAIHFISKHIN